MTLVLSPRWSWCAETGLREHPHFVIEHGRDNVAIVCGGLLSNNHPVTIANGGVNHGISDNLQHE
jgi:hypothetical protein